MTVCEDRIDTGGSLNIKGYRGKARRYLQNTPLEDFPTKDRLAPKGAVDGWDRHSGPSYKKLVPMLRRNVGRPWSKVYSELIADLKANYSADLVADLRKWIDWHVETSPTHIGNGVYFDNRGHPFSEYGRKRRSEFYVNPDTGLLCEPKLEWCRLPFERYVGYSRIYQQNRDEVRYIDNHCYRKIKGIWYEVILENVPKRPSTGKEEGWGARREDDWLYKLNLYDVVLKLRLSGFYLHDLAGCHGYRTLENKLVSRKEYTDRWDKYYKKWEGHGFRLVGERYVWAKSLRQLSKAELRRLSLNTENLKVPDLVRKHRKRK